jgi:hypothetical protein
MGNADVFILQFGSIRHILLYVYVDAQVRAGSVCAGFVVDKVALGQAFVQVIRSSPVYRSAVALHTNNMPVAGHSSE